jgi:hypothetical protein
MHARFRGDSTTSAPSRHAASQERIDYTDPQVLMFNNLMLLGFNPAAMEKRQGVPFGPTMFSNTGATRQCDCVVHFLLSKIYPSEAATEFKSVWPILDRIQQREFKKISCGMLVKLQKTEAIPSQPQIRPSSLDTPNGDRFCMLLWAVSNHALVMEFKRRYPAQYEKTPRLSAAPEMARMIIPIALRHQELLRSKFLKSAEHLANLDAQWAQVGEALGSTYRELRSQFASLQEQAQAAGLDPLTAAEHDDAEPSELAHIRNWHQHFAADYSGHESARALVLDILNQRAASASLDAAKISAALGDSNDSSGPLDLGLVLDKWSTSLGLLRQELGAHNGHPSSIASVAAQAQALEAVVEKRDVAIGAVVKLRQEASDALSDAARSLRRKIVNLGTHAASFPPSPSLRLAPSSPPPLGDMFFNRVSPIPVAGAVASASTPSTLRRAPNRLWPLESGCVAAAGALTPAGMQRLADSVRKAAKREAGVPVSGDSYDLSEKQSEDVQPQQSSSDALRSFNRPERSPADVAPLIGTVPDFIGSVFTPPESAGPRTVPIALFGSQHDAPAHYTTDLVTKSESTFITTPEHLNKLESLQRGNLGSNYASLITSPVFPSSLRKNASPPPPFKMQVKQDPPATGFQHVATVPSKGSGFNMSSKQRLLSATAAKNSAAFRKVAVFSKENESIHEDQLAKELAAKRRLALQRMSKNAIADEIADGVAGTGEVFNNNPFEIRKELPRTPEVPPSFVNFSSVQSSPYANFTSLASERTLSPAKMLQTTQYATVSNETNELESQSPLTSAHTQPSPAHQSAAEAYYAAMLNPTPSRVTATAIDMASPLLKEFVPSYAASSTPSIPKFVTSPVSFLLSPSRYAGDPFPSSPAAHFHMSHVDREQSSKLSLSASDSNQGTPDAVMQSAAAHADAPHSAASASSWLKRGGSSQSDASNLPSPDLVAAGSTPWKACTYDTAYFSSKRFLYFSLASSIPATACLDIGNFSFEDDTGDFNHQQTPSSHASEAPTGMAFQQDPILLVPHTELQPSFFEGSKAKVTDSESPSNLPRMVSKISIHAGSSTPSLSAIKRKAKPVAIAAKMLPQPVFKSNAMAWGVSVNSDADADADSIPSTTTSTWTSSSVPSVNASDDDADFESAPDHWTSSRQHMHAHEERKATSFLKDSDRDAGPDFEARHVAVLSSTENDASKVTTSPSDQWGTLVDCATAKSPVSKFNASWCVPSPNRRRTSVTPSILHQGVQPSPFNNPAVFANSPHDSSMNSSSRIDEDVTINMGYYNPANDVSMRTAKDSPFVSQSPTDMDISADREPTEAEQLRHFAGVHHVDQYAHFARADSSSSAASSVTQGDAVQLVYSHSEFHRKSNSLVFEDGGSFVASKAAAAPRMELLKELLSVRNRDSSLSTSSPHFSRLASNGAIASSVLHEAAIKNASSFAPSRDSASLKTSAAPNFQDELRKRLSAVKASTHVSEALVIPQPTSANNVSKTESPYVQKSVGELKKQLLSSKTFIGAGLATKTNSCKIIDSFYFSTF